MKFVKTYFSVKVLKFVFFRFLLFVIGEHRKKTRNCNLQINFDVLGNFQKNNFSREFSFKKIKNQVLLSEKQNCSVQNILKD